MRPSEAEEAGPEKTKGTETEENGAEKGAQENRRRQQSHSDRETRQHGQRGRAHADADTQGRESPDKAAWPREAVRRRAHGLAALTVQSPPSKEAAASHPALENLDFFDFFSLS